MKNTKWIGWNTRAASTTVAAVVILVLGAAGCGKSTDTVGSNAGGSSSTPQGNGGTTSGGTLSCAQKGGSTIAGTNLCRFKSPIYVMYNSRWLSGGFIPVLLADDPQNVSRAYRLAQARAGDQVIYTNTMHWGDLRFPGYCDEDTKKPANVMIADADGVHALQKNTVHKISAEGQIYFGFDGSQQSTKGSCVKARGDFRVTLITCQDDQGKHTACP